MNRRHAAFFILFSLLSGLDTKSDYPDVSDENWKKMQQVHSMSDFKRLFNIKDDVLKNSLNGNFADEDEDSTTFPECQTRERVIKFKDYLSEGNLYYPSCVLTHQCDGCCQSYIKKCEPISMDTFHIGVWRITSSAVFINVPYQNHTRCACRCLVKESDAGCNEHQIYNNDSCSCSCKEGWRQCPQNQQYSGVTCRCECSTKYCPIGRTLNETTCECESKPQVESNQNVVQTDGQNQNVIEDIVNGSENTMEDDEKRLQHENDVENHRQWNVVDEDYHGIINDDDDYDDVEPEEFYDAF